MIVEGKITEIRLQDGEEVGTIDVRAVIKPVGSSALYMKGLRPDSQILVKSPRVVDDSYQRFFLEQVGDNDYQIIKAEEIHDPEENGSNGVYGLAALVMITIVAFYLSSK
jgi:hypothetical protein